VSAILRLPCLFQTLIAFQPRIRQVLARRVGSAAAADLSQDLFLRLQRISGDLPSRSDARRFIMRMALNAATDHLRLERRRSELLAVFANGQESSAPSPEEQALVREQIQNFEVALARLPPKVHAVLFMSRVEGRTHAEIAYALGVSKSLVEKYVVRGLLACRAALQARNG